jgi:hypothetical protein
MNSTTYTLKLKMMLTWADNPRTDVGQIWPTVSRLCLYTVQHECCYNVRPDPESCTGTALLMNG